MRANITNTLRQLDDAVRVINHWDALEVRPSETLSRKALDELETALTRIAGIQQILVVENAVYRSFEDTAERLVPLWQNEIAHRRFKVRVKRRGNHDFRSEALERYLGSVLLQAEPTASVDLTHPDVEVALEIKGERMSLVTRRTVGLGGYPLGTQGAALALVSGGYDSPVAAYRMIRRGLKTHFLFFNLGGPAHEAGVRDQIRHLWQRYSTSHRVNFISVPFESVVNELMAKIPDGLMGVVLKRMMLRAANRVAAKGRIPVLVTGDAIAQVSSQSLTNLGLIDAVAERPVLRPLVVSDKQDIIDEARRIDTARFAETMPEYCGVISKRPNTRAKRQQIEDAETAFDFSVLEQAVENTLITRVDELPVHSSTQLNEIEVVDTPEGLAGKRQYCIIDIRHPSERDDAPLNVSDVERLDIPFYELQDKARELASDRYYLLYCDQGVMSRMQALHLADQGLHYFGVYRHITTQS
ncbi:tRNA sulfurtransferase [Aidingimonas halophila]|nr:tRNA sulfurtransferase [Aidingimonas halophila]